MKLLRFLFGCLMLAICLYFAATVRIGKYTLIGHVRRIASTPEAKDLADGTKQVVKTAAERVKKEVEVTDSESKAPSAPRPATPPSQ